MEEKNERRLANNNGRLGRGYGRNSWYLLRPHYVIVHFMKIKENIVGQQGGLRFFIFFMVS